MSRRIEIELTSARPDGTWTWRVAGAREPRGILDGTLLPAGAKTGSVLKADAEVELEGYTILSVGAGKEKAAKAGVLDLLPSEKPFEAVTQQLAKRDRNDRGDRSNRGDRRDRPPRRDGPEGDRRPRRDGDRPPRREGEPARGPGSERPGGPRPDRGPRPERRTRPNFSAPPELPQRPKPKRLKPGRAHRSAVLADLPEEQRPVAERALQGGLPGVRQAVNEQNARLRSEGKPEVPAAGLLAMAEQLLPRLRVAEWLDRADAAMADIDELDLRDLRSVVAAGEDPMVARDESTRAVATELKAALVTKQESELALWFEDIDAAIGVGRVIRALKLSSQPPKAGVRFPTELAGKLAAATTANLSADALADRWVAVIEAAAFSPVRAQIQPTAKPTQVSDELLATVKRLGPLLPQIAALFEIEISQGAPAPKPLRPTRPTPQKKAAQPPKPKVTRPAKAVEAVSDPLPAPEELLVAAPAESPELPEAAAAPEPEVEAEVIAEPEAIAEPEPEVAAEAIAEPEPEVAPEPEAIAEPEPEVAPEPEAIAEPEPEPEVAPEPEAIAEPEVEVEVAGPAAEPEVEVEVAGPAAEPEVEVEVAGPAAEPEVEAEVAPD